MLGQLSNFIKQIDKVEEEVKINEMCMNSSPAESDNILNELRKVEREYNSNHIKYRDILNRLFKKETQRIKGTTAEKELQRYKNYYENKLQEISKKVAHLEKTKK